LTLQHASHYAEFAADGAIPAEGLAR